MGTSARTVLEIEESWEDTPAGEAGSVGVIGFTAVEETGNYYATTTNIWDYEE